MPGDADRAARETSPPCGMKKRYVGGDRPEATRELREERKGTFQRQRRKNHPVSNQGEKVQKGGKRTLFSQGPRYGSQMRRGNSPARSQSTQRERRQRVAL